MDCVEVLLGSYLQHLEPPILIPQGQNSGPEKRSVPPDILNM